MLRIKNTSESWNEDPNHKILHLELDMKNPAEHRELMNQVV